MNKKVNLRWISLFRSGTYMTAALICLIIIFSFSENNSESTQSGSDIRMMTYNIHHGERLDGVVDLERIADVINDEEPDILLLQEVDLNLERSGNTDISERLSELTGLEHVVFGKNLNLENGGYGNTTLSKFSITESKNYQFEKIGPEQRGVLTTIFEIDGKSLLVMNAHFDHSKDDSERVLYVKKVIGEILPEYDADVVLFGGDFNDIPSSRMYDLLAEEFEDIRMVSGNGNGLTFPANQPSERIDYIFYKGDLKPTDSWIPKTEASDHRPIVADFVWVAEK